MRDLLADRHIDVSYIVAAGLVCFYALSRFNTPRTARSQTSQAQYFGSCVFYVISYMGLFMALT